MERSWLYTHTFLLVMCFETLYFVFLSAIFGHVLYYSLTGAKTSYVAKDLYKVVWMHKHMLMLQIWLHKLKIMHSNYLIQVVCCISIFGPVRLLWGWDHFAKLSPSSSSSLTELVIFSANPATRHPPPDTRHPTPDTRHPTPDTRTSINLASYNSKLKGKVVYIDIMNSKASLNSNFINHRPNWPLSSIIWGISWFSLE